MNSPTLLHHFERCDLAGYWARDREREQPDDVEMLQRAIRVGLTTTREDHGEAAGEECYGMGATCGLQTTSKWDVHSQVTHLSCLSDILSVAVRRIGDRPWSTPEPIQLGEGPQWSSGAYLDPSGTRLRRIALASNWGDDRHFSECRAWHSLGEVCAYELPMQLVVAVIGQNKSGKRHSFWTRGLRHPANKTLRFRKKNDIATGFKSTWEETWREDHDEISAGEWLEGMIADGVIQDVLFKIDIPVPVKEARQRIVDLAARKLDHIYRLEEMPDKNLSTCDWPKPCMFRNPCHKGDQPNGRYGFIQISGK